MIRAHVRSHARPRYVHSYDISDVPTLDLDFHRQIYRSQIPGVGLGSWSLNGADSKITFTRASTATYFDPMGVMRTAAAGDMRIDHDPATGECLGLLVEESRTNLLTYSEDFSNAAWNTKSDITLGSGVEDPFGGTGAFTVTATAANGTLQQAPTVTAGVALTGSIWIRRRIGSGNISVRVGELTTLLVTVTSDWVRVDKTNTPTSIFGRFAIYIATSGDAVDIWGAQLEVGSTPSSYIPTTTAAVTRAADVPVMSGTNFSDWYNQSEGAMFVSGVSDYIDNQRFFDLSDGANTNRIGVYPFSSNIYFNVRAANTAVATISSGATPASTMRTACGYKTDSFAVSLNGAAIQTDTSGNAPTGIDRLHIGCSYGSNNHINGHIKRLQYYPRRLTDAQLVTLST